MKSQWYEEEDSDISGQKVISYLTKLKADQQTLLEFNLQNLRLYGSLDMFIGGSSSYMTQFGRQVSSTGDRHRWNICQSVTDTLTSKIAKNKPRPLFLSSGGDFYLQKKAKLLNKFMMGQFENLEVYRISQEVFKDACIFGTGIMKIDQEDGKIFAERVLPTELWIDDLEGLYGSTPQNCVQVKPIARDLLISKYPKLEKVINDAPESKSDLIPSMRREHFIDVIESWHISAEEGKSRHLICIHGATLEDLPYSRKTVPFAFYRWNKRPIGFWGQGVIEMLRGIQFEINLLLYKIQKAMEYMYSFWILKEQGSNIPDEYLDNNDKPKVINFVNTKPEIYVPNVSSIESREHLQQCWNRGYEIVGLSQLSASSKKPAGITAGVALREMNDIETERFMYQGLQWEYFFIDVSKQLLEIGKQIADEQGEYSVPIKGSKFFNQINWSDIDMTEDQYSLNVFPISLLPSRPEGRIQKVQEYMQAGIVSPEVAKELLAVPDVEQWEDLDDARRAIIRETIQQIMDKEEYQAPEPTDDLAFAMEYVPSVISKCRLDRVPDHIVDILRQYLSSVVDISTPPQQEQPAQPMAQPESAPPSNLLPFSSIGRAGVQGGQQ